MAKRKANPDKLEAALKKSGKMGAAVVLWWIGLTEKRRGELMDEFAMSTAYAAHVLRELADAVENENLAAMLRAEAEKLERGGGWIG